MKTLNKTQQRVTWIEQHRTSIEQSRTNDHTHCQGRCHNGLYCYNQSRPGYGWIARALLAAGINPERTNYWSGSNPTPSTSINRGIANYIDSNAPLRLK